MSTHWGNCSARHGGACDCGYPAEPTETDDTANLVAALDSGCNDGTDLPGVLNRAARKIEAQAARIAELKAERDALAAVIGVPSDILADVKADVWDECLATIEKHELNTGQAREGNPYRKKASE